MTGLARWCSVSVRSPDLGRRRAALATAGRVGTRHADGAGRGRADDPPASRFHVMTHCPPHQCRPRSSADSEAPGVRRHRRLAAVLAARHTPTQTRPGMCQYSAPTTTPGYQCTDPPDWLLYGQGGNPPYGKPTPRVGVRPAHAAQRRLLMTLGTVRPRATSITGMRDVEVIDQSSRCSPWCGPRCAAKVAGPRPTRRRAPR